MLLLQGPLTFVAVRAALDELGLESTAGTPPLELPPSISRKLYEIIAITAMQFRGYIFKVNEPQVCAPCSTHPAAISPAATGAAPHLLPPFRCAEQDPSC
jgi:hypothetical protein